VLTGQELCSTFTLIFINFRSAPHTTTFKEASSMRRRGEQNTSIVEMRKSTQRWRAKLLNKWPNMNEITALRTLLNSNRDKELRTFGTVTHTIKCKW
jgi:hypothetical protein